MDKKFRPLAFYLPQFHPIPENDLWWGKGFTEWTNVTKSTPRFPGHYQPHLPSDYGFYDLRIHDVMEEQAVLAKKYGLDGFVFYHYWFNGKRLLETPVNNWIKNKSPDFPFCLCWANENWTRKWDGNDSEILIRQEYNKEDDEKHMRYLCESIFSDKRYIKVHGKPMFAVYRTESFPDMENTAKMWKDIAIQYGFSGLYLVRVESFLPGIDPKTINFDASIEFQPDWKNLPERFFPNILDKIFNINFRRSKNAFTKNHVFLYEKLVEKAISKPRPSYKLYPGITPMWDNSSRIKNDAGIFYNSTPLLFKNWLNFILHNFTPYSNDENFIFINAWNEWGEGAHLEPCQRWSRQYLEALYEALRSYNE